MSMRRYYRCALGTAVCLAALLWGGTDTTLAAEFVRGDVNFDGEVNLHDAGLIRGYLAGDVLLPCHAAADANSDGDISRDDALYLLEFLYEEGSEPGAPYPAAGEDPVAQGPGCAQNTSSDPVDDPEFALEITPSDAGHRGTVSFHGHVRVPRAIEGLWVRVRFDPNLAAGATALVDDSIKDPSRYAHARLTEDGAVLGVVYSFEDRAGPRPGETVEAFTLELCVSTPTPQFSWDFPIEVAEIGYSVAGELAPVVRQGDFVSAWVGWGISHSSPSCLQAPPRPEFFTCQTLEDGRVFLSWMNTGVYDSVTVAKGTPHIDPMVHLPGDTTSWIDEEGGSAHNYVYKLRAHVRGEEGQRAGWGEWLTCWATDPSRQVPFVRGDVNSDGELSTADIAALQVWLFEEPGEAGCWDSADVDDDGNVNITDQLKLAWYLFGLESDVGQGLGDEPPAPFPDPGFDTTQVGEEPFATCEVYQVTPPRSTEDAIRLGGVEVQPGDVVEIPVYLSNSVHVNAVQLVVEYDPELLRVESGSGAVSYEGTFFEQFIGRRFTRWTSSGSTTFTYGGPQISWVDVHPEDGIFTVGIVNSLFYRGFFEIPPGEDTVIAKIRASVSGDAEFGSMVPVTPVAGPDEEGYGPFALHTELVFDGEGRYATLLPTELEGALFVSIVGDISFFRRGDANGDEAVDISDAVYVLDFLFSGNERASCQDAADADDSGVLDITDPILILNHLFAGAGDFPPPYPAPGRDPSPDFLPPCRRTIE